MQLPFDIITAFSVTFDRHDRGPEAPLWTQNDWRCFLLRLAPFLQPGGTVLLQLNTTKLLGCLGDEFKVFRSDVPREAVFECVSVGRRQVELHLGEPCTR